MCVWSACPARGRMVRGGPVCGGGDQVVGWGWVRLDCGLQKSGCTTPVGRDRPCSWVVGFMQGFVNRYGRLTGFGLCFAGRGIGSRLAGELRRPSLRRPSCGS